MKKNRILPMEMVDIELDRLTKLRDAMKVIDDFYQKESVNNPAPVDLPSGREMVEAKALNYFGNVFITYPRIEWAKECGVSTRTVTLVIKDMCRRKLLKWNGKAAGRSAYKLVG